MHEKGQGRQGEPLRCAGFQGTPLGGFADLKEVPSRCSKWRGQGRSEE
ncbi:MAG: hypothetical protein RMX68_025240 [Aulosira sp. ZfuVER01]